MTAQEDRNIQPPEHFTTAAYHAVQANALTTADIIISHAVGRSSGGASGSCVTSTQVPGRSLKASPAVVQPGRTEACTSRTDKGAYLKRDEVGREQGP